MARRPKPLPSPARPPKPRRKPRPRPAPEPEPALVPEPSRNGASTPPPPPPDPPSVGDLQAPTMEDLPKRDTVWLVPGVLAREAITIIEGDPGTGKSVIAADLAAALSKGREWGGRPTAGPVNVLLYAAEDDHQSTIRPRLVSAEADLARVRVVTWEGGGKRHERPSLPGCAGDLVELLRACQARLLIVDTLGSLVAPGANINLPGNAEDFMAALQWVAHEAVCAIFSVRHHNKASGQRAIHRGAGNVAITGGARVVLALARGFASHAGVLAGIKSNLGPLPEPEAYRLEPDGSSVRVRWLGRPEDSVEELLSAGISDPGDRCKRELAEEIIRAMIGDGWTPAQQIFDAAREHGIGERTVWSARARLGCRSRPATGGAKQRWEWGPPPEGFKLPQP